MESTSPISNTVMRRVRVIHTVRPFLSSAFLASLLFLLALWGIGREVWFAHVVQNFAVAVADGSLATYLTAAFVNTRFIVQVLVIVCGATFVYGTAELVRSLSARVRFA